MYEGLWIVQYAGMEGKDGGVVVLTQGEVLGGDSAFTYAGTYRETQEGFHASILVQNFNPKVGNVLGIQGDFALELKAKSMGIGIMEGAGATSAAPGFGLRFKLTRRTKLTH